MVKLGKMESTVFVSLKQLLRERKSQSENPLGITCVQPEDSANITRQATEDKTNDLPHIHYHGVLVTRGASDCA